MLTKHILPFRVLSDKFLLDSMTLCTLDYIVLTPISVRLFTIISSVIKSLLIGTVSGAAGINHCTPILLSLDFALLMWIQYQVPRKVTSPQL